MSDLPDYIHFSDNPDDTIGSLLENFAPDKVAVLVDEMTREHCLPKLPILSSIHVIEIKSGEKNKTLETCDFIWREMSDLGFSRKSLLINLGGGVIGDMGGFTAATYKRGIRFINVPTTLLSQVDASIGGKLGIDFHGLKNHVGVFKDPDAVILSSVFLDTLSDRQLKSGYAEVIKHGLIWDEKYWAHIKGSQFPEEVDWSYLLKRSVEIKGEVVIEDPLENGLRKILNFGHTLGHAFETWHLDNDKDILHGEAIGAGMIMEGFLSREKGLISATQLSEMEACIDKTFSRLTDSPSENELFDLLSQDKKNERNEIRFSLIDGLGSCAFDVLADRKSILFAVEYYFK